MPRTDKRIDAYIAKAPDFAKPILTRVRALVHEGAPHCEETLKWGHPSFVQDGLLCGMAAFKEHCAVNFWKSALILGSDRQTNGPAGVLRRIRSMKDLPPKRKFVGYVRRAVELNATGTKVPRPPARPRQPITIPDEFRRALARNAAARRAFEGFSPSHQREYLEWITDAKQDATRERRIAQALEWLAEGKPRNWKYMRK
jgi:uncharacterized protein YdeI (YjbR/CyaY-like superfamily)